MKVSELFPSDYLKSADIEDRPAPTVIIQNITIETMSDGAQKPVLQFQGKAKKMVLNKTNATALAMNYGDDTSQWIGKQIQINVQPVQGPTGITKGLRVAIPASQNAPLTGAQQPQQPPPMPAEATAAAGMPDEDIPF